MAPPAPARHAVTYGIVIALLCLPALWNGFPLMFRRCRWLPGALAGRQSRTRPLHGLRVDVVGYTIDGVRSSPRAAGAGHDIRGRSRYRGGGPCVPALGAAGRGRGD